MRPSILSVFVMAWVALASVVLAQDLIQPDAKMSPEDVVRTQLDALQANDTPSRNAGIRQVWEFAHPVNRRMTGPYDNFAVMMKGPFYNALINHSSHAIKPLERTGMAAAFDVDVTSATGLVLRYRWVLERAFGGGLDGAWMTVSVSIAQPNGREI
ncbi:MAG: DUF4864 domain-containing protein [Alphaproteobacteria bacterium]|nr:DUF4864 domain-containing protein [Alphaproteobacteria bacterium]